VEPSERPPKPAARAAVGAETVELGEAAERLGVHYQTAYQWVRSGELPAVRVRNRYRIDSDDLQRFADERDAPRPVAAQPRPRRWDTVARRVDTALREGDERTVRSVLVDLRDEGVPVTDLIGRLVVPALRKIGAGWVRGEVSIAEEHRATALVERVLGELAPNPMGRRRGTAVVASVSGDHHTLPTTMAAVALREDRWKVEHLGADVPGDEVLRFAVDHGADLVVLTVTNPEMASAADDLCSMIEASGIPAIVGAPGRTLDDLQREARAAKSARRSTA